MKLWKYAKFCLFSTLSRFSLFSKQTANLRLAWPRLLSVRRAARAKGRWCAAHAQNSSKSLMIFLPTPLNCESFFGILSRAFIRIYYYNNFLFWTEALSETLRLVLIFWCGFLVSTKQPQIALFIASTLEISFSLSALNTKILCNGWGRYWRTQAQYIEDIVYF